MTIASFISSLIHYEVGFEIIGSKLKSSVNGPNLFKVFIVSSTPFHQRCAICSLDSSSLSSSPFVITSVGCSENSKTIYSTENGQDWLVPSRKCTLGTLNWMVASLLGLFFSNSSSVLYFVFKVTTLCFLFVVILHATHKQFSFKH